jgi:hypothetical protein
MDFKDAPVSVGEIRGKDDCSKVTPRELLIQMLREIDKGTFKPDGMLICYFYKQDEGTVNSFRRSKTTIMEAVAMIEIAKHDLLRID